ncbi:MAG TPA: neutral zinc metallopeptidase [Bacillota bacterium]|nr:neutral zinc metallopeptidase [Bacillota bacterium]
MKWKGRAGSRNVEDRRGSGGFGMGGKGILGGGLGIVFIIVFMLLGGDPGQILSQSQIINQGGDTSYEQTAEEEELAEFASVVLADTEAVWQDIFYEYGEVYQEPILVLYSGYVQSACGTAGSSTGPFYCPGDNKVYIDLSFFQEMETRFDAPGDFAMAYVIAHEVGHHVQNQLGIMDEYQRLRSQMSQTEFNKLTVRLELQADYLAGVWAHYVDDMNYMEDGDIQEAMNAASAVGDDRIQKQTQGYVVPDSFTHGTSEQRMRWFMKGYNEGDLDQWDTFSLQESEL